MSIIDTIDKIISNTVPLLAKIKLQSTEEISVFAENIINTIREPLLALDKDLRVVKASRSFYDFFKVTPEETIGTLIYDLGNRQWDIPILRELLETILPEKTTFDNYEVEHDFSTIGKRIMLLNARQIERAIGKEKIILLAIEDITERRQIEAGLGKTRKELVVIKRSADELSKFAENIINTIREPLLALDKDLRVVKASRSFYDFFKVTPVETVGTLIYDLGNHQWNIPKLRELLETILPEKTTLDTYEVEHDFSTIGKRIMLLNARQIERTLGEEKIILLAIEDITERRMAENSFHETSRVNKEYLDNIVNYGNAPIIAWDSDLKIIRFNHAFEYLTGYASGEVIQKQIDILFPENKKIATCKFIEDLKDGKNWETVEINILNKDQSISTVLWNAANIYANDGMTITATIAQGADITERIRVEEHLRSAVHKLECSNKELEQFAYVASHDLQEPLRMVSSYTQLLGHRYKDKLDEDANDFINFAVDGAIRMQQLINDLLDYSRVTTKAKEPKLLDANALLGQAVSNLQNKIETSAAMITNDELPEIRADEGQLVRVFQNLIANAIKFAKIETPRIHISCAESLDSWLFSVKDNGIGIEARYQNKIFVIFQRLHTMAEYPGTGIGLAICKRIIERHGGKIWFCPAHPNGTIFYFTISKNNQNGNSSNIQTG